jgi:LacI family transcriptional regulator
VNLETIARLAGVSRSTVSRVVNDDPRVSDAVRARVEAIIRDHHFQPNAAARSLASRRTRILGLRIPDAAETFVGYPYFAQLTQGVSDACNAIEHDLLLMMENDNLPETVEKLYRRVIRGRHVDGVVVGSSLVADPLVERLHAERFPMIVVGHYPTIPDVSFIDVDNRGGVREAVLHLVEHGCRRIATISGQGHIRHAIDRTAGYQEALEEAGIAADPNLIHEGVFTEAGGYRAMKAVLEAAGPNRPDAVFVASDAMAVGARFALDEAGIRVPDDIKVIGFDGLDTYEINWPSLSTVRQPVTEQGTEAVNALLARIERPNDPPIHTWLPTTLIRRGSCGCAVDLTPQPSWQVDCATAPQLAEVAADD